MFDSHSSDNSGINLSHTSTYLENILHIASCDSEDRNLMSALYSANTWVNTSNLKRDNKSQQTHVK